jgi:predicted nucleotidyltransferase
MALFGGIYVFYPNKEADILNQTKVSRNKMIKTIEDIKKTLEILNKDIKKKYKAEIIGIFGSYVRGEQKKKSDLDVLVKFDARATLFEFVGLSLFLEEKLGIKKVDVVPFDEVREEIRDRIFKEAVYL